MIDKAKEKKAIQTAIIAGVHLDHHEAITLIKRGFFKQHEEPIYAARRNRRRQLANSRRRKK